MFKSIANGKLPTRGSQYSACVDLYANKKLVINPGQTTLIPLGIAIDDKLLKNSYENNQLFINKLQNSDYDTFLKSHYFQLMLRSSLSKQLIIANGVGIIDIDYRDEIMIRVHNPSNMKSKTINLGDRVAQITLLQHSGLMFDINTKEKRNGGFGSTGNN